MNLVVEIPDDTYKYLQNEWSNSEFDSPVNNVVNAVINGKQVPSYVDRLGDVDELIARMKERNEDNGGYPLNMVDRGYDLAYQHLLEEIDNLGSRMIVLTSGEG